MTRKRVAEAEAEQELGSKARIRYLLRNRLFQQEFNNLRDRVLRLSDIAEQLTEIGKFENKCGVPFLARHPLLFQKRDKRVLKPKTIPVFEKILTSDVRSARLLQDVDSFVEGNTLYLSVDLTCNRTVESLLALIDKEVRQAFPKRQTRQRIDMVESYLAVWDLRQQGLTADSIALKLWPAEYEKIGGRDSKIGYKGPLIQRVSDYEKAAQKVIKKSFPPRKHSPKIKK